MMFSPPEQGRLNTISGGPEHISGPAVTGRSIQKDGADSRHPDDRTTAVHPLTGRNDPEAIVVCLNVFFSVIFSKAS